MLKHIPKLFGVGSPAPAGVLGRFAELDAMTDAIRRLRAEGHTHLTTYAPTPRHEIEEALEGPESPVRIFTLTGAFLGTAVGAALALWSSLDWPLVTGGKEIASIPAFVVIMFECTILIGALSTVAALFINGRLPHIGPQEGAYHPSFTAGHFGVFAHGQPDRHEAIGRIMRESGAAEVIIETASPKPAAEAAPVGVGGQRG